MLGIFLDTETNGLNPQKHKVLEIAYKIVDMETGTLQNAFETVVAQNQEVWKGSDPASLKVNGFTWEEVSCGQSLADIALIITNTFKKHEIKRGSAVFICQNPSFDRAFFGQIIDPDTQEALLWPYHWLDLASMYWADAIKRAKDDPACFPWNTGFSKDKIALARGLPKENSPHRAMNGVNHLLLCYEKVIGFPKKNN
jgi:DNA polymerase-3 subunit epsilon/oligoribonuclease